MSTKIFGGRVIPAPIGRAYEMLLEVKPQAIEIGTRLQNEWMTGRAVEIIDQARIDGRTPDEAPLVTAWTELLDRLKEIRKTGRRDPAVDIGFELWLFPRGRRTLLMAQTEQRTMREWFDAQPFVRDYAYWNSSDPDEEVEPSDWDKRREDWESVLPGAGIPSDRCLTFVMFNGETPNPAKAVQALELVPPIDQRLTRHAADRHITEVMNQIIAERRRQDPHYEPKGFDIFFEARRAAGKDETRRAEIVEELRPHVREITAEELMPSRM